jgi:probable HAF family extracellular repeat protein
MILVLLVFCFAYYSNSWATPSYKYAIKRLTLGGMWSTAIAINELGQVVGASQISGDTSYHGFIYYKGKITDIGSIYPYNINNFGQVIGHYNVEINGDSTVRSFIYRNGMLTDLGTISSDPRAQSWANDINDLGQVVGSANTVYHGSHFHAYSYSDGVMEDIDTIGPYEEQSEAWAINNHGMVVGSERGWGVFLYSDGVMKRLNIVGNAFDMNDRGEFVGRGSWGPGLEGAFFYREGELIALGDLSESRHTTPRAINECGQIVGQSDIGYVERPWGYSHIGHAFLYNNGRMTDLNTLIPANSGWELIYATDINNHGQIVGYGVRDGKFQKVCYKDGSDTYCYNFPIYSAFLLTPILGITIDIKPWWNSDTIYLNNEGIIPVAILSTMDFHAPNMLKQNTITFGAKGNEKSLTFCRSIDVNRDGYRDLLCFFNNKASGLHCGDTKGILKGKTVDGIPVEGRDSVKILSCQ